MLGLDVGADHHRMDFRLAEDLRKPDLRVHAAGDVSENDQSPVDPKIVKRLTRLRLVDRGR